MNKNLLKKEDSFMKMKILWICLIFYVIQCNGLNISDPLVSSNQI